MPPRIIGEHPLAKDASGKLKSRIATVFPYGNTLVTIPVSGDGAIELVFDRAMDHASVEESLEGVTGSFQWVDDSTLTFIPDGPFAPQSQVRLTIDEGARAANGLPLAEPVELGARRHALAAHERFANGPDDLIGGDGQVGDPHAGGPGDSVGHRRGDGGDRRLADADRAGGPLPVGILEEDRHDLARRLVHR